MTIEDFTRNRNREVAPTGSFEPKKTWDSGELMIEGFRQAVFENFLNHGLNGFHGLRGLGSLYISTNDSGIEERVSVVKHQNFYKKWWAVDLLSRSLSTRLMDSYRTEISIALLIQSLDLSVRLISPYGEKDGEKEQPAA